jgi:hypothetical protein
MKGRAASAVNSRRVRGGVPVGLGQEANLLKNVNGLVSQPQIPYYSANKTQHTKPAEAVRSQRETPATYASS